MNHGTTRFDDLDKVLAFDKDSSDFFNLMAFNHQATLLPKAMRDKLLMYDGKINFNFKTKVLEVKNDGELFTDQGEKYQYDHILITSPLEQIREMLKQEILTDISYSKCILFIGNIENESRRIEMDEAFSENFFDKPDSEIIEHAKKIVGNSILNLEIKKWRYSTVKSGYPKSLYHLNQNITLSGDAFDSSQNFRLGAAWLSGMSAGKFIKEKFHGA